MKKRKLLLSIVVSVLLPGIEILGHNIVQNHIAPAKLVSSWLGSAIFLFILWVTNQFIEARRPPKAGRIVLPVILPQFFASIILIVVFAWLQHTFVPPQYRIGATVPLWLVIFKPMVGFALIITIQGTLRALQQKDAVTLANARLRNENLEARLQSLKQQINPHFLFNALSTLRTMVRANDANAEKFIMNLSDVYRQLLSKRDLPTIPLCEEIELVQSYLFMQQARFENTLLVSIDNLTESRQKKLPAFSLLLLAENCIKHNVISAARPLHIKICQQNTLSVMVENNLQVKASSKSEFSGTGLQNLEKRYELLGIGNGVNTTKSDHTYTVVLKLLP